MPSKEELRKRPNLLTDEVQWLLGNCHRTTIDNYVKRGKLSPPAKPTERRCLYDTDEVFALIDPQKIES